MTNPFAAPAPQQAPPAQGGNPFGQPQPAQPPAAGNPFGGGQQVAPPAAPQQPYGPYGHPGAPTTHSAPVAQPAPAAVPSGPAPVLDPNSLSAAPPPPPAGSDGAQLADMYGRLVIAMPLLVEVVPKADKYITDAQRAAGQTTQERMTVTMVVLDDGNMGNQPIAYGGAPYALPPTPHDKSADLPYVRTALWVRQGRLIAQLKSYLPAGPGASPGMAVGRVLKAGPAHNDPWYLSTATEAEVDRARQYLALVGQGRFPNPLAG